MIATLALISMAPHLSGYSAQIVNYGIDSYSQLGSLSENGHVAGDNGSQGPFVWSPERGTVSLKSSPSKWESPYGNNSSDMVCGQTSGGIGQPSAIWWPNATTLSNLQSSACAVGINDLAVSAGGPQILGYYYSPKSGWWLSQVVAGKRKIIDMGAGYPMGINQGGAVCGMNITNLWQPNAMTTLWRWFPSRANGTTTGFVESLTVPGGLSPYKINAYGDCVVAAYRVGPGRGGCLWLRGANQLVDLGYMGDNYPDGSHSSLLDARGINDSRSIVGGATYRLVDHWDYTDPNNPYPVYKEYATAFLWTANGDPSTGGVLTDLNNAGVTGLPAGSTIKGAKDINNSGQILVTFSTATGTPGVAVLTPF